VRVDETRDYHRLAEPLALADLLDRAHCRDAPIVDRDSTVLDRRALNR
jgi:hypothetical protein